MAPIAGCCKIYLVINLSKRIGLRKYFRVFLRQNVSVFCRGTSVWEMETSDNRWKRLDVETSTFLEGSYKNSTLTANMENKMQVRKPWRENRIDIIWQLRNPHFQFAKIRKVNQFYLVFVTVLTWFWKSPNLKNWISEDHHFTGTLLTF